MRRCVWLPYARLMGDYFARVLVFLGIALPLAFAIGSALYNRIVSQEMTFSTETRFDPARASASMVFGLAVGGIVALFVSRIFTCCWSYRAQTARAARERQYAAEGVAILHPAARQVKRSPKPVRLGHS